MWVPGPDGKTNHNTARRDRVSRRMLFYADVAAAAAALALAEVVSGSSGVLVVGVVLIPALIGLSQLLGLYRRDEVLLSPSTLDEVPKLAQVATTSALLLWFVHDALLDPAGAPVVGTYLGAVFAALVAFRLAARALANRAAPAERCLVIGEPTAVKAARETLRRHDVALVAELGLDDDLVEAARRDPADGIERLGRFVEALEVDRVILAPDSTDVSEVLDLVRSVKALGLKTSFLPRLFEVVGTAVEFENIGGVTLVGVRRFGLSAGSRRIKRVFDSAVAGLALVALLPVFLIVGLAICLTSPGPVFFRQTRMGRKGRTFTMLKFRTMCSDAEQRKEELRGRNEAGDGLFKIADDPRVTPIGRFLRRTALDEIPQLINVLRGEMSLVGPRPLIPDEDRRIQGWYRRRLDLMPGMTGHWQILGSSRIPLREMVKIDYLYIANWSLWLDLKIMFRTVVFMFARQGV